MNIETLNINPFFTPNKKYAFQEENLSILNTAFTSKSDDILMEKNIEHWTPVHNVITKADEKMTSPLVKFRRRTSITPFDNSEEEDQHNERINNQKESLFEMNFDDLKKKNSFHLLSRENSSESYLSKHSSSKSVLKFGEKSFESSLSKETTEIFNELKGSILLFRLENEDTETNCAFKKQGFKQFFEANHSLMNKIVKDVSNSFFEGFNIRDNFLFFQYFMNSTTFEIVESGINNLNDTIKFLEENIDSLVPYTDKSQVDLNEKEEEKLVFSTKGECRTGKSNPIYFILSLMIRVNLMADLKTVTAINEIITITEIKLLVFERN